MICTRPPTLLLTALNFVANTYERVRLPFLRKRATSFMLSYIEAEDAQTKSICIGPVNKFVNMLAIYTAYGKGDSRYQQHAQRVDDYFWLGRGRNEVPGL